MKARRRADGYEVLQGSEPHLRLLHVLTPSSVQVADELGVDLWTINGESDMRCVLKYGVDGIMTDCADVLNRALDGEGKRRRQAAHCARMSGARA